MSTSPLFKDRAEAGQRLAEYIKAEWQKLDTDKGVSVHPIVYALPRGGIPVAAPVALVLDSPLDIVVAKKISLPENPELAVGAVTSNGQVLWSDDTLLRRNKSYQWQAALLQAQEKAQAQLNMLSSSCPQVNSQGAIGILIDDGIATGMTIAAAALELRTQNLSQLWICAQVAPEGIQLWLQQYSDRVILPETPYPFLSVSRFYDQFPQVDIQEAKVCLQQHNQKFLSQSRSPDNSNSR